MEDKTPTDKKMERWIDGEPYVGYWQRRYGSSWDSWTHWCYSPNAQLVGTILAKSSQWEACISNYGFI